VRLARVSRDRYSNHNFLHAGSGLLTVTPGLDTALVLRTATVEGTARAAEAARGIIVGLLSWAACWRSDWVPCLA
jgi:threonine/homoserine/homoserine lactone efflux protein